MAIIRGFREDTRSFRPSSNEIGRWLPAVGDNDGAAYLANATFSSGVARMSVPGHRLVASLKNTGLIQSRYVNDDL